MKVELSLNDLKYFELFIGTRVLKSEVFNSKGSIPVYSANVFEPFGFLDKSNIDDFSLDYVLWGIDGDFKFNIMRRGVIFATTDHCGAIKILDKNILPEYLLFELELQNHILGFDRTLRSSLTNMKNVSVKIPIDKDGNFDLDFQKKIVQKHMSLKTIKENIKNETNELSKITFSTDIPKESIVLKIEDIFDLTQSTNHSKFTREFVNKNKGDIPVFSASKNPEEIVYGYVKDNLPSVRYFENILTWNIDGSVGKAFFRKGKFSLSEKVIPLILKEKWKGLVDYEFVKYVLEEKAIEMGFAFSNKAGKTRIKDIEIEFPSIIENGINIPDINKQKQIAGKYRQAYVLKDNLIQYLQGLNDISVEI